MANKTPHVVGGGLGSFGALAAAKREADRKANQEASRKAAMSKLRKG